MGMRTWVGLACVGTAALLSACSAVEEPAPGGEQVSTVAQQNVLQQPQASDSLTTYAARCDAATGIHVPAFSCNSGLASPAGNHFTFIDQKSSIDNITHDGGLDSVGTVTGNPLTPADVNVTAKRIDATGGSFGSTSESFRFGHAHSAASRGATEVKIVSYQSTAAGALAGLMLRTYDPNVPNSGPLDNNAPYVMLSMSPTGTVALRYRTTQGAAVVNQASVSGKTFPIWLRLSWEGGIGTRAEISTTHDPNSWQLIGVSPPAPPLVEAGVAVAAASVNYDRFYSTAACDSPSGLGASCDLKSTFQVLARTADAIAVANCRNSGAITPSLYSDIAVIQYNRKNGALCFYQSNIINDVDENGTSVSAPSDPNGTFDWLTPTLTHQGNCTGCHDTGGLIRSPYLKQTGLLPDWRVGFDNNGANPLSYVGHDFQNDRSYTVATQVYTGDTGLNCTTCHSMAVNNVDSGKGTSMLFADEATSELQTAGPNDIPHKNPASVTSPLWMRPSFDSNGNLVPTTVWDDAAKITEKTALNYRACGAALQDANTGKPAGTEWDLTPITTYSDDKSQIIGCSYGPRGFPYSSPIQILEDIAWGNGGSSTGTLDNVTLNSGPGTDIFGTSDTGVLAQTLVAPGDGRAMVKVTSLKNTNEYAKAGIMFRGDGVANAANVMVAYTAQHGVTFQYRPTAGATTPAPIFLSNITTLPVWLRLDRSGETFVGYVSTDNRTTWQQVAPAVTLPGYSSSILGLVNTAHTNATQPGQATFEDFDFTHGFGWDQATDPHVLADVPVGSGTTGSRTEWITREYVHAGGNNGGGDIQNTADKFYYSFRTFNVADCTTCNGTGQLLTTVESLTSTAQFGKAGLMMRDSIADTAKNVFVGKIPGGVTFQYRDATGQGTTVSNVTTNNQSTDFRLDRTGSTFAGYYKLHGATTWIALGSHTFSSFNVKALTGLAVSTQTATATTDAVFYSGHVIEPPGFLWPNLVAEPDPTPPPTGRPCDSLCTPPSTFTWSGNNFQSGALGTGAVCMETTHALAGGNCSNVTSPRTLQVNGVTETCNGQNWSSVPAARNGGYCVALPAGQTSSAAFALW